MNAFEMNKIIGAILGTLVLVMGVGFLANAIYAPIEGRGPGYNLPVPESAGEGSGEVEAEPEATPLSVLLASASADDGAGVARKCAACHSFEQSGANKVGPALFGIVGASIGAVEGFGYSDILGQLGGEGGTWTYENLNTFLTSPKEFAPGTKMSFAGLRKEDDRADLLAYMRALSAAPVPFPAVENAAEEAAPEAEMVSEAAAEPAPETAAEPAPETPVEEAVSAATDSATEAVQDATDKAAATDEVVNEATEAATIVTDTASEAASTVTDSVTDTAAADTTTAATEVASEATAETTAIVEEAAPSAQNSALFALLNSASAEDGARVSRKCAACHSFDEGGNNKVGPALYDIVGSEIGVNETFRYSDVFKAMAGEGAEWSFEALDAFLEKPTSYAPRTKMAFGGLSKPEDRAAIIVYMRGLSGSPVPLP